MPTYFNADQIQIVMGEIIVSSFLCIVYYSKVHAGRTDISYRERLSINLLIANREKDILIADNMYIHHKYMYIILYSKCLEKRVFIY